MDIKIGDMVEIIDNQGHTLPLGCVGPVAQMDRTTGSSYLRIGGYDQWLMTKRVRLAPATASKLDWTKPIQWESTVFPPTPATLVGKSANGLYVVEVRTNVFHQFNEDGTRKDGTPGFKYITNVPPPPVWPQTRYFLTWEKDGQPRISGPANAREGLVKQMEQMAKSGNGHHSFNIQEVTFHGKA